MICPDPPARPGTRRRESASNPAGHLHSPVARRQRPAAPEAEAALNDAAEAGALLVSPITAWEIGTLVARGRIMLPRSPRDWFEDMIDCGVVLAGMSPRILVESSFLPGTPPRDLADRIIAATARAYNYRLMTRDQVLLDYGAAGHVNAMRC